MRVHECLLDAYYVQGTAAGAAGRCGGRERRNADWPGGGCGCLRCVFSLELMATN